MEGNNLRNEPDAGLPSFQPSVRRKDDTMWRYITERTDLNGKRTLICDFCQKESGGGGINRMKQHLAGIRGNIGICTQVSADVQFQMKQSLKENEDKSKEKRGIPLDDINIVADMDADLLGFFKTCLSDPTQPSIKASIQSKEKVHDADLAVVLWSTWANIGCTLMGDGWKDTRKRPLINFLVYCLKGVIFIKSVDASDIYTNAENLCNLFSEMVEMVGLDNVVHLVTDNAPNYKALGKLLAERYPNLAWSPCAAHCMNLKLEDVGNMPNVQDLVSAVSKFLKTEKARYVKAVVLDENMWEHCLLIVRIMAPMIRLLRVCDTDEKPSLPYVYEGMYRVHIWEKRSCINLRIIKNRWDRMLRHDFHAAAYFLNPAFMYDQENFSGKPEILRAMLNLMEKQKGSDRTKIFEAMTMYREREKSFSHSSALSCCKTTRPDEWWKFFGYDVPVLQKLAIRILSQTA
ncbi:unnamed protein product [Brassica oleracea]